MDSVDRELQKQHLTILASHGQPQFTNTWFPYTSGEVGPYYVQSVAVTRNGDHFAQAVEALCTLISSSHTLDGYDIITGGETRDWAFSFPVAYALGKPHAMIYNSGKVVDASLEGKRVLHVADLNNEGSSFRDKWVPTIRKAGGEIVEAFFYVDRREDGVQVLENRGVPSSSVVPLDSHAWDILREQSYITPELYDSLQERMEDKRAWAHRALRGNIEQLENMLLDRGKRAKALKIINIGYPEIAKELVETMNKRGHLIMNKPGEDYEPQTI
ncbi:hypothetical protein CMO92_00725 [Candidatus Woesearchaeota archaeon]|nr:hypothetical protein [Candidatus Woesearchaeota archaeon]|tara:strand:- start:527 stop:1342 length:816 start_codon:yes stop_codon:yes gene_type:complete